MKISSTIHVSALYAAVLLVAIMLAVSSAATAAAESGFEHFISVKGDKLMDGGREYRFVSFNIPNLHYVEDNLPFTERDDLRLPDAYEITDALVSIRQLGGRVARLYTLSVRIPGENRAIPRYVLGPGQFNEEAFRTLDKVLEVANREGVRVIIPFVDNWKWWGGIREYATWRGKKKEAFWTDTEIRDDFKKTIHYVINRTNTYTGVKYKDDKAIMAWETGNELESPYPWTRDIVRYIKQLDGNHLVIDGFHTSVLREESIEDEAIDVVTTHHYPRSAEEMIGQVRGNIARSTGKKPYFVGEFGFIGTAGIERFLDMVIDKGVCGALIWSLRYHNKEGGFYWHSEPFGGDKYKAYHWPGFPSGDAYDETNLLKVMREKAYAINGQAVPAMVAPAPPRLLPFSDVSLINWQGATGAASYTLERAANANGPWQVVAKGLSDAAYQYRPLYNDASAELGGRYYYRLRAVNAGGVSEPSEVVGPVTVRHKTLVDEFENSDRIAGIAGKASFVSNNTRKVREDIHRLRGSDKTILIYKTDDAIRSSKLYAYFPEEVGDFMFAVSPDGKTFHEIPVQRTDYFGGEGNYGYWKPVLYQLQTVPAGTRYLRIKFGAEAELSRLEIVYGDKKKRMTKQDMEAWRDSASEELERNILSLWLKHGIDEANGGFYGRMSNDWTVEPEGPKGLVLNARLVWTFAAAYRHDPKPEYLAAAQRAYGYLIERFQDREQGGYYWLLNYKGEMTDAKKEMYAQAFVVYALAEYHRACGSEAALKQAVELYRLLEKHGHDDEQLGYFETFERDWRRTENIRVGRGHAKSMNTHLHVLEAWTNLYRVWQDEGLRVRLAELIDLFLKRIIEPKSARFILFFDDDWKGHETDVVSFGHDIEGSWLLCEAAEVLGDEKRIAKVKKVALRMAEAALVHGLDADGGLFYEGQAGRIINDEKHWWPQAEAAVGFLNAYQLSGEEKYRTAALGVWDFIRSYIVDHEHGEWYWQVSHDRLPNYGGHKVSEWKAPYHNGRACMELIHRLELLNNQ